MIKNELDIRDFSLTFSIFIHGFSFKVADFLPQKQWITLLEFNIL